MGFNWSVEKGGWKVSLTDQFSVSDYPKFLKKAIELHTKQNPLLSKHY